MLTAYSAVPSERAVKSTATTIFRINGRVRVAGSGEVKVFIGSSRYRRIAVQACGARCPHAHRRLKTFFTGCLHGPERTDVRVCAIFQLRLSLNRESSPRDTCQPLPRSGPPGHFATPIPALIYPF